MNRITEHFTSQTRGYDKNEVNRYIQKITEEYNKLQEQYVELSNQHELLLSQTNANMEVIFKVLVDAELNAKQITADAKNEAARIIGSAHMELQKLQQDKASAVSEINDIVNRLRGLISTIV